MKSIIDLLEVNKDELPSIYCDMDMVLCEPIRELYKDEVRSLAEYLEVSVSQRQPFPGPGLAVRVMGEATPERTEVVRQACHIAEEEIESASKEGLME